MYFLFVFFFFSSRRRHTRFDCDWSSDVCSSDLDGRGKSSAFERYRKSGPGRRKHGDQDERFRTADDRRSGSAAARNQLSGNRSEEHTSELQSQSNLVCRLLLEKKKKRKTTEITG